MSADWAADYGASGERAPGTHRVDHGAGGQTLHCGLTGRRTLAGQLRQCSQRAGTGQNPRSEGGNHLTPGLLGRVVQEPELASHDGVEVRHKAGVLIG